MAYQPKSYRKFIAGAAAAAVVAPVVAAPAALAAAAFDDVAGTRYEEAVTTLAEAGIVKGNNGSFAPYSEITRGEAAIIVARALDLLDGENIPANPFSDVGENTAAYEAIAKLADAEIIGGYDADTFGPYDKITRGQMAKIIAEALSLELGDGETSFSDVSSTATFAKYIDAIVEAGIASGKTDGTFGYSQNILRGDFAVMVNNALNLEVTPAIDSVSAVDATTVKVNFNTAIANVDHTNFALNGGVTVYEATLSSDKKSVELKLNNPLTSGAKYTVTTTGIESASGNAAEELKSEFVYTYDYGVTVQLEKTALDLGQTSKIILKDKDGKDVTPADLDVSINNTNVVTYGNGVLTASNTNEGSAEVVVKATLSDDTVVTNTFNVTVEDIKPVVENKGFTLVADLVDAPKNTVEFNAADKDTTLSNNGEVAKVALFNTTDGNPDAAHVNFTGATVKSLNPTIATAAVSGTDLVVTANNNKQTGAASFEITFADETKKTISVDVIEKPAFKEVVSSFTSVVLSDEAKGDSPADGVNEVTIDLETVDQYGDLIAQPEGSKITVSTNEEGITLGSLENNTFTITAQKGKVVPSAQVKVNYFAKSTDTTPALTKTINVKVVDVDATKAPVAIDVVPTFSTIDATPAESDEFTSTSTDLGLVYELDKNGNRIGISSGVSIAALSDSLNKWLDLDTTTLGFDADAEFLMSEGGKADLKVTASGITVTETIDYTNSKLVPAKVAVDTKPVSIKLATGDTDITLEEILFGTIDGTQVLTDAINGESDIMAVKKEATNAGYKYNKPLVSVTDVKSGAVSIGANVYGLAASTVSGNAWDLDADYGSFVVDASVVNAVDVTVNAGTVGFASGKDAGTFTIVLKSVKVKGDTHTDANLLAAPVSVNVTLTK